MLTLRIALCVSLLAGSCAASPITHAQDNETEEPMSEARALFMAGRVAFNEGRYDAALKYFQAAHEQSGRPALVYNIAQCEDRLGHSEQALAAFERYLQEEPAPPHREQVEGRIETLRTELAARLQAQAEQQAKQSAPLTQQPIHQVDADSAPQRAWLAPALMMGAAGVVSVTGGALMIAGNQRNQDVASGKAGTTYDTLNSEQEGAQRTWLSGQVLLGVGGAAMIGGVTWLLLRKRATAPVQVALSPNSVRIAGSF